MYIIEDALKDLWICNLLKLTFRIVESISDFEKALELDPENPVIYSNLGYIFYYY